MSKPMVTYLVYSEDRLNEIQSLWEALNAHHLERSTHFTAHFTAQTFEKRAQGLREKAVGGQLRIDLAHDVETGRHIGYCVSTITSGGAGEIDSIFIDPAYRGQGIGDALLTRGLEFLQAQQPRGIIISVGAGNEEVFPFYARHGFFPSLTILVQGDI